MGRSSAAYSSRVVRLRLDVVLVGGGSAAAAQSRLRGHAQRPVVRLSARRGSKRRRDKRCTLRRARLVPMRWMRNLGSHPRENYGQAIDFIGEPAGTRTQDHLIKSQVLYHLSYGLLARSVRDSSGLSQSAGGVTSRHPCTAADGCPAGHRIWYHQQQIHDRDAPKLRVRSLSCRSSTASPRSIRRSPPGAAIPMPTRRFFTRYIAPRPAWPRSSKTSGATRW